MGLDWWTRRSGLVVPALGVAPWRFLPCVDCCQPPSWQCCTGETSHCVELEVNGIVSQCQPARYCDRFNKVYHLGTSPLSEIQPICGWEGSPCDAAVPALWDVCETWGTQSSPWANLVVAGITGYPEVGWSAFAKVGPYLYRKSLGSKQPECSTLNGIVMPWVEGGAPIYPTEATCDPRGSTATMRFVGDAESCAGQPCDRKSVSCCCPCYDKTPLTARLVLGGFSGNAFCDSLNGLTIIAEGCGVGWAYETPELWGRVVFSALGTPLTTRPSLAVVVGFQLSDTQYCTLFASKPLDELYQSPSCGNGFLCEQVTSVTFDQIAEDLYHRCGCAPYTGSPAGTITLTFSDFVECTWAPVTY